MDENISFRYYESNLDSVDHVRIQSEKSMNYFSNTTELTFNDGFSSTRVSIVPILNRIIPLKQPTKLIIEYHHLRK